MNRVYNFSAGPATLPEEVLQEAAAEMMDYQGCGMSVMEISHRTPIFDKIIGEAEQDDPQYRIIPTQFECISDCLGWDMVFAKTYTAGEPGDLAADGDAVKEIEGLWETLL